MKLSIVVPAFNEEKLLAATLACIHRAARALTAGGWSYELIVCDNNSTDRTAQIARAAGAHVVFEPVNQISRARNAGARAASGEWLLFVDADCSPSPALFSEVMSEIRKDRCIAGGCTVRLEGAPAAVRFWVMLWNALSRTARWAAGSFFFCEARVFREAGGFSEDLYAAEEIDLSRRLKRRGRLRILHRHPLVTSGRKARLYAPAEHFAFLLRFVLTGGRTVRSREGASIWYDGRR